MKNLLTLTLETRNILNKVLLNTPREALLKIPKGYNNNIWWNIAHVVVTQQLLTHKLSGVAMNISNELVDKFKKGTTPDGTATDEEIEQIKALIFTSVEGTISDYESGLFKNFNEYPTSTGVVLKSLEDAVTFNLFHEGVHLGAILALKKAIRLEA